MIASTLRLFNAVQVEDKTARFATNAQLSRMVKYGYLLDPAIPPTVNTLKTVEDIIGLSGEQANAAFHKSWKVVRDTPMETLVIQQLVHYVTTYGFESLGIYDKDTVYIPKEALDIPDVSLSDIPITVIRAMTPDEILSKIVELGGSGVALMKETLDDIMEIIVANSYDESFVREIKNRELKALLYDLYGLVPDEPVDYLRYVVAKISGKSLLIKNKELIDAIKGMADPVVLDELLLKAPGNLASIFFRFKPIFLAMKWVSQNKTFFNRLRRRANQLHRPLPEDYLNNVTSHIKSRDLDLDRLFSKLENASIFRKIRLANALHYRRGITSSIVYRVRNGRGWATSFDWPENVKRSTQHTLQFVVESIASDLREKVGGKTIYIPEFMHYTLPATEKQFTGNFPTGTSVSISGDTIVGIHWVDKEDDRVDLDLSMIGESGKLGWDGLYRSEDLKILFSGDMTSALPPKGATELFYFNGRVKDPKIILVNYYNFYSDDEVWCALLVAQEKVKSAGQFRNYMVDPNNILAKTRINISKKQNVIGLIANVDGKNRIYFANMSIGNSITASMSEHSMRARSYLVNSVVNCLPLRDVLIRAGAVVVDKKPEGEFIDLSPELLNKTTILNLISK